MYCIIETLKHCNNKTLLQTEQSSGDKKRSINMSQKNLHLYAIFIKIINKTN